MAASPTFSGMPPVFVVTIAILTAGLITKNNQDSLPGDTLGSSIDIDKERANKICDLIIKKGLNKKISWSTPNGVRADTLDEESAFEIVKAFLETEFSKELRHERRLEELKQVEEQHQ